MTREWTLDIRHADGEWRTVEHKPSADAAKAWARTWWAGSRRTGFTAARIFDPLGRLVYVCDFLVCPTRLRWQPGNYKTREQLAAVAALIEASV